MLNKFALALILSLPCTLLWAGPPYYKEGATIEEKNTQDRCDVLNSLAKRHAEILSEGPKKGLYSIFGNFDSLMNAAADAPDQTTGVQRKFLSKNDQKRLLELLDEKRKCENNIDYIGAAKVTQTIKTFVDMNTFVKRVLNDVDAKYPECMILNGGKQSKPTGSQPTTKPTVPTPVR